MAEEREEVEAWAKKVFQLLLFLASSLTVPAGFFGVSFGYPSFLACSRGVKVG